MKKIILSLSLLLFANASFCQNDGDMIRYAMQNVGGTSRTLGMANSFGALGADISSMATNPAGLGLYRSGELSFSLGFNNRYIQENFLDGVKNDNQFKMSFSNAGMLWHFENQNYSRWKGWTFGFGYNQTNNFSANNSAVGFNAKNSILHAYCESLGTFDPSIAAYTASPAYNGNNASNLSSDFPFDIDLAWQTYLIDSVNSTAGQTYYFNSVPFGGVQQSRKSISRGGGGEFDISFANNFDNKLFFGATIGFASVNYSQRTSWKETDTQDTIPGFYSLDYNTELTTSGSAINLKLGVIYRPIDAMRIGFAFHTPNSYLLTDDYSTTLNAKLENLTGGIIENDYSSPLSIPFQYRIMTPMKFIGSIAGLSSKIGAVNLDYEYNDYSKGSVYSNDATINPYFNETREAIKIKYQASHTLRLGFESVINQWRIRAGVSYSTSPFKSAFRYNTRTDLSKKTISTGFGYKGDRYFFDMAISYAMYGLIERPYAVKSGLEGKIESTIYNTRILFTIGKKF
ncbi:MAG: OmpP1/FadL family transporter [Bacteroidota bacterium]